MSEKSDSTQEAKQRADLTGAKELERLRTLLFGAKGQHVRNALSSQSRELVSKVVSEAIVDRQKKDTSINTIVTPLVEDAVQRSVASHGEKLTSILYPLVGRLVRKSVSVFFTQFVERTNDVIERAVSIRGLMWRYQAWRSGVPFSQFLAAQTYEYRVEQVLLIHRETGLLIKSVALDPAADEDADLISAMLTAIGDFVSDSFKSQTHQQELDEVKTDDFSLLISRGPHAVLVAAVSGVVPSDVRQLCLETLENMHSLYTQELADYSGDNTLFETADPVLRECLAAQMKAEYKKDKKKPWFGYLFVVLLLGLLSWLVFSAYERSVLLSKLEEINGEPGILVTQLEIQGNKASMTLLKDAAAISIRQWLAQQNIKEERVNVVVQPFLSLEEPIILRKITALADASPGIQITSSAPITLQGKLDWQQMQTFNQAYFAIPGIGSLEIDRSQVSLVDISLQADQQPAIQRQLFEQLIGEVARIQIDFEVNETQLNARALENIQVLAQTLDSALTLADKLHLSASLIIIGASDTSGVSSTNRRLSLERANAVKSALINRGIAVDRLFSAGIGEITLSTHSVATRRVMFNVMYTHIGKQ